MDKIKIKSYIEKLLKNYFPDNLNINLNNFFSANLYKKMSYCFKNIHRKYYNGDINKFDLFNGDHLCILFYLCSIEAYENKKINLAKKFFLLNKIINGIDLFYEVRLPKIFLFIPLKGINSRGFANSVKASAATLAEETNNASWEHYFAYVNLNRATHDIKEGTISPWLVLNTKAGKEMLTKMNDEQLTIVEPYIDPQFWKRRFKSLPADTELVKDVVKEAKIL